MTNQQKGHAAIGGIGDSLSAHSFSERSQASYSVLVPFLLLLPIAGIAGVFLAARELLVIFLLLALTVFIAFRKANLAVQDRLFATVIVCVSLTLLLSSASISNNLHGWDIHGEFNIFLSVLRSGYWRPNVAGSETDLRYVPALSISILPAMVGLVSGLDGVRVFESVLPAVFSIAPLVLYKIYRRIMPPNSAFLSVFLFMSYPSFYQEMVSLGRQEIAELLLVLLLLLLFSDKIQRTRTGKAPTLLLIIGIVLAHYSIAFVLVFALAFSFVLSRISRKGLPLCSGSIVVVSAVIAMSWYLFVASGVGLLVLAYFPLRVLEGVLGDFMNPASRPVELMQALGLGYIMPGFLHQMNRLTQYFVQFCIALGLVVFLRRRQMDPTRRMSPLMILGFVTVLCAVVLPNFASAFNLSRFYHIGLLFIAPCFVYGAEAVESGLHRMRSFVRYPKNIRMHSSRQLVAAIVLFSYFLFTSGWVWAATMDRPTSYVMDAPRYLTYPDPSLRVEYYGELTAPRDIAGAQWIRLHLASPHSVCADYVSTYHVLNSYGELPRSNPLLPFGCDFRSSLVFLSELNTRYQTFANYGTPSSISEVTMRLTAENMLYSNGGTIIYGPWSQAMMADTLSERCAQDL